MEQFNDYEFENYLVQRALPMMLQNDNWRNFLINNAIDFIGVHNLNTVHQDYVGHMTHIANNTFGDDTPMSIGELLENNASPLTDNEDSPTTPVIGGKRRKRTRKRRKRRKSRQ